MINPRYTFGTKAMTKITPQIFVKLPPGFQCSQMRSKRGREGYRKRHFGEIDYIYSDSQKLGQDLKCNLLKQMMTWQTF